jgi:phospholipid/cholesterol/gamma-HCH transport system permease protein
MASEIGSMKVTEQIDAMRALGTDPIQKLVTPRLIATATVLPLLTILADRFSSASRFPNIGLRPGSFWSGMTSPRD